MFHVETWYDVIDSVFAFQDTGQELMPTDIKYARKFGGEKV